MAAVLPRTVADRLARSPIQLSGWVLARRLPARPVRNVIRLPMQRKAHCQGAYIRLFYISAEKSAYLTIGAFLHRYMSAGGSRESPASPHTRFYLRRYADSISRTAYSSVAFSTACQRFDPTGYDPADASTPAPASADCVPRSRWWFQNAERSACRGAW